MQRLIKYIGVVSSIVLLSACGGSDDDVKTKSIMTEMPVTVRVDMGAVNGFNPEDGVYLKGDFTGNQSLRMDELVIGNGRYFELKVWVKPMTEGSYYVHIGEGETSRETIPSGEGGCRFGSGSNRKIVFNEELGEIGEFNQVWSSCATFTLPVTVTFNLDMRDSDKTEAWIAGELNGWSQEQLKDADGDGIFSIDIELKIGDKGNFRFYGSKDWADEEPVPLPTSQSTCGNSWLPNPGRSYDIVDARDYNVVWGTCNTFSVDK